MLFRLPGVRLNRRGNKGRKAEGQGPTAQNIWERIPGSQSISSHPSDYTPRKIEPGLPFAASCYKSKRTRFIRDRTLRFQADYAHQGQGIAFGYYAFAELVVETHFAIFDLILEMHVVDGVAY